METPAPSPVRIQLPDGSDLPNTPLNRRRARKHFNLEEDDSVDRQLTHEEEMARTHSLELQQLRDEFESAAMGQIPQTVPQTQPPRNGNDQPQQSPRNGNDQFSQPRRNANDESNNSQPRRNANDQFSQPRRNANDEFNDTQPPRNGNEHMSQPRRNANDDSMDQTQETSHQNTGLVIGHPAIDIICEFADAFKLEANLRNDKKGISTIYDYFENLTNDYKSLAEPFTGISQGTSLEYAITRFKTKLKALKKPTDQTMEVLTILAVNHYCPDISHKLSSVLISSCTLTAIQRKLISSDETPTLDWKFSDTQLTQLPGIREIHLGNAPLSSLSVFILHRVTRVSDISSCLESATAQYYSLDGINHTDCDLLLSEESRLYRLCASWKGRDFLDPYDRAVHFMSISPLIIRSEYATYIAEPSNRIDLINIKWHTFETISRTIWKSALKRQQLIKALGLAQPETPRHSTSASSIQETISHNSSHTNSHSHSHSNQQPRRRDRRHLDSVQGM
jgi:hypothetical protein